MLKHDRALAWRTCPAQFRQNKNPADSGEASLQVSELYITYFIWQSLFKDFARHSMRSKWQRITIGTRRAQHVSGGGIG